MTSTAFSATLKFATFMFEIASGEELSLTDSESSNTDETEIFYINKKTFLSNSYRLDPAFVIKEHDCPPCHYRLYLFNLFYDKFSYSALPGARPAATADSDPVFH